MIYKSVGAKGSSSEDGRAGMPVIETIAALSNLAGVMVKVWSAFSSRNERQLDREHQLLLQEAQHRHELALAQLRAQDSAVTLISIPSENSVVLDITHPLLQRLQMEAEVLGVYGFEVIYEQLSNGSYGLALPVGDDLMFCFLLSYAYPYQAPTVLIKAGDELQQVAFEPDTWNDDVTIASLVQDMASAYFAEEDNSAGYTGTPATPLAPLNP